MNAYQCDICGKFISNRAQFPKILTYDESKSGMGKRNFVGKGQRINYADICEDCGAALLLKIDELSGGEKRNAELV